MSVTSKNNFIGDINKTISNSINDIKYGGGVSDRHRRILSQLPEFVTIDWKNMIPSPPENDSEVTKKELRYISRETAGLTPKEKKLVEVVDKDPFNAFKPFIEAMDIQFPVEKFKTAYRNSLRPVFVYLKHKYNRPRPFELAPEFNIDINRIVTDTHQSPAYPSGHTSYAAFLASMLSSLYPAYSDKFYSFAGDVGRARILQGVHYPSDNNAAMLVGSAIWEDIKYKVLPDLEIKE
tara:strand:+ start:1847 stop:2554 length:708 start_codon:yes stop_codon:yes gene_type:complete